MLARPRALSLSLVLSLATTASLGVIGCNGSTGSGENIADDEAALELDNGGMTTADEEPAFGDEAVASAESLDATFADQSDVTTDIVQKPGASRYRVMLLWGHLPAAHDQVDDEVTPSPIDWTGTVSVDTGAIGVKRTLRFDPKDHLDPRTSPAEVSFVSHTLPAVDGLLLDVALPADGTKVLHFDSAALQTDIDLADLDAKGRGVVPVGDGKNALAFAGYAEPQGCAKGFVFGRWVKKHAGFGHLRGRVIDGVGDELGHVRGLWGHAPKRDKNVFFGKFINAEGQFRALFGGTYGDGSFEGLWKTKDVARVGTIEGRYFDGPDQDDGKGFFVSRWSEKCAK
ncbi:MAG: hypothetical protein U0359_34035 [Byssovorax sp.]